MSIWSSKRFQIKVVNCKYFGVDHANIPKAFDFSFKKIECQNLTN